MFTQFNVSFLLAFGKLSWCSFFFPLGNGILFHSAFSLLPHLLPKINLNNKEIKVMIYQNFCSLFEFLSFVFWNYHGFECDLFELPQVLVCSSCCAGWCFHLQRCVWSPGPLESLLLGTAGIVWCCWLSSTRSLLFNAPVVGGMVSPGVSTAWFSTVLLCSHCFVWGLQEGLPVPLVEVTAFSNLKLNISLVLF